MMIKTGRKKEKLLPTSCCDCSSTTDSELVVRLWEQITESYRFAYQISLFIGLSIHSGFIGCVSRTALIRFTASFRVLDLFAVVSAISLHLFQSCANWPIKTFEVRWIFVSSPRIKQTEELAMTCQVQNSTTRWWEQNNYNDDHSHYHDTNHAKLDKTTVSSGRWTRLCVH